jgi:antitoxin component of MazEF toxin-antitoxin module
MKAKLRRVGNSIGLTIPASELRAMEAGNGDIVEVELKRVIRSAREGWDDAEQWRGAENEVMLLDVEPVNDFDDKDWQW